MKSKHASRNALVVAMLSAVISLPAMAQTKAKPAAATSSSAVLVKVNGSPISTQIGEMMLADVQAQGAPKTEEVRNEVRDELIRREVIAQEARKKGYDKSSEAQARLEMARQSVMVTVYLAAWDKANPISEAAIKAEYDRRVATMSKQSEYDARHIVVSKEEEAKAIIAKLQAGGKFEDLVKDSIDPGTRDKGGELGWAPAAAYVKPVAEALVKLKVGDFTTQAVQSEFGFHIIQLKAVRDAAPPSYEAEKANLAQALRQKKLFEHVEALVSKAKIE